MSDFAPYEPPARIAPEVASVVAPVVAPELAPVGWLVWPARVIALGIVLPVRLAWEGLRAGVRLLGKFTEKVAIGVLIAVVAVLGPLFIVMAVPIRILGRWVFCPLTAGLGRVLTVLFEYVALPVLRALRTAVVAIATAIAALGRTAWAATKAVAVALGQALVALVTGLGRLLHLVLVRPFVALATLIGRGLAALGGMLGIALSALGRLAVVPLQLLWRWVLRPVGAALVIALLAITVGAWRFVLQPLLRGIGAALKGTGRAVIWAWHTSGRILAAVGRAIAVPLVWIYRHVLTPIGHAVRAVWRSCVVAPLQVVRRTVAAATAATRRATTQASAQVRAQMRLLFGRAR